MEITSLQNHTRYENNIDNSFLVAGLLLCSREDFHKPQTVHARPWSWKIPYTDSEYDLNTNSMIKHSTMKKNVLNLLLFALPLLGNTAYAQVGISVNTEMIPFDYGPDRMVHFVTIPFSELNAVTENWNNYLGDSPYGWESKKNGIHRHKGVREKSISDKKFTVHNEFVKTDKGVRLTVWFTQNGRPLEPSKIGDELAVAIKKFIRDFAIGQYREGIQIQLQAEQNLRRKIQMELGQLKRHQEKKRTAITKEKYAEQSDLLVESIKEQNLKMHALLQNLNVAN